MKTTQHKEYKNNKNKTFSYVKGDKRIRAMEMWLEEPTTMEMNPSNNKLVNELEQQYEQNDNTSISSEEDYFIKKYYFIKEDIKDLEEQRYNLVMKYLNVLNQEEENFELDQEKLKKTIEKYEGLTASIQKERTNMVKHLEHSLMLFKQKTNELRIKNQFLQKKNQKLKNDIMNVNIANMELYKYYKNLSKYINDFSNELRSLQNRDSEIEDELEENNIFTDILKQLDEKNIDNKWKKYSKKEKSINNKSQLPVIKQKQIVNNKETKPKTNLPVINNKKYNSKYNSIRFLINSGRIKGNNMDFFRRYQEKYDWRDIRNQQIKQKNILPLINK